MCSLYHYGIGHDVFLLRKRLCRMVYKPGSVPARRLAMTIHLGHDVTICLLRSTLATGRDLRAHAMNPKADHGGCRLYLSSLRVGLAVPSRVAADAVRSYRTFSPLLRMMPKQSWQRYIFCGAFPKIALAGSYPAPLSRGARTFLLSSVAPTTGDHPTIRQAKA